MKKILTLTLALLLCLSLLAGCGGQAPETDGGENSGDGGDAQQPQAGASLLGEDNTFVVGFDQDFPPFGYVGEDGEFTGFDIETARELANRLGWAIELQPIDWDAKDFELESGTIDCIWNGFTMNGREDEYTWTVPYYDNTQVFIVREDAGIVTFDDLAGKIVAVQKDSSALAALQNEENAALLDSLDSLLEVAEYNTAFMDLEQGTVDAVAMDAGVAAFQMEGRSDEFVVLEQELSSEQYGIGFKLGNTELRDAVENELLAMAEDGTLAKIAEEFVDTANVSLLR